ncbi:MAG TPA: ABC transporter ATP-binding protein [Methylomirabilota bacterium]|nr:ABC transporter ATP-binding protein [Methylomirabilota bacterium]
MTAKLRRFATQLSYALQTLRLIWRAARKWTLVWLILLCIQGVLPAALVYLSRSLVDNLAAAIGTGWAWENLQPAAFPAALMIGIVVLIELTQSVSGWIRTAQAELIRDYLSTLVHEKSVAVDLAFYESPEYHDHLERARNDLSNRPLTLLENVGSLLQNLITLFAMATLLIPYGVWLPCVLFVSTVPTFYVVMHFNRRYHRWWECTTPDRRRAQYYDMMLTHSAVAAELRLFDLGPYFQSAYQTLRKQMRAERLKLIRNQTLARLGAGLAGVCISGIAVAWMFWRSLQGRATPGDLALFYQAFQRGQGFLRSLLENIGQIYTDSLFLGNLFEFLQLQPQVRDPLSPVAPLPLLREGICFQHVAFRYPGSERRVLQDFNLTIPAGQIVAIVGANGAGKSTLLKLLCRFYDPEAGLITLDGSDIRDVSLQHLRRMMTVLFQWPVPYQATAAQNIAFGDLAAAREMAELEMAARSAGAHEVITGLPRGYDTLLGKWFANGVELSIGEWQRLALARAFFRRAPILILDEPTSALDSWAEADWFDRFRALANGRTAIIITHRFTIARRADMIHVMDAGRIVESGNHEELLARGGLYAQSWTAQGQGQSLPVEQLSALATSAGALLNGGTVTP